jgi:hypothetical protein
VVSKLCFVWFLFFLLGVVTLCVTLLVALLKMDTLDSAVYASRNVLDEARRVVKRMTKQREECQQLLHSKREKLKKTSSVVQHQLLHIDADTEAEGTPMRSMNALEKEERTLQTEETKLFERGARIKREKRDIDEDALQKYINNEEEIARLSNVYS